MATCECFMHIAAFIMWCWKFIFRVLSKFIEFDAIAPSQLCAGRLKKPIYGIYEQYFLSAPRLLWLFEKRFIMHFDDEMVSEYER